ncbi:hypothetical protein HMPREF9371_0935 [Neisseria shayeganii 871]|uniref:Uncharacterized protein n=1 Tax=Neisseria shayeganii 871 TaxID=1032488 RepID=G4CH46_9NEIS|nr:hypothetical protein HMPREF9371_0935 [Neisseria shayeganii 871]
MRRRWGFCKGLRLPETRFSGSLFSLPTALKNTAAASRFTDENFRLPASQSRKNLLECRPH